MSARTMSRLDASIIARKGEAVPSAPSPIHPEMAAKQADAPGGHGTIAVTVRLDPGRYERMKLHGARTRTTNQAILVAALDAFLQR